MDEALVKFEVYLQRWRQGLVSCMELLNVAYSTCTAAPSLVAEIQQTLENDGDDDLRFVSVELSKLLGGDSQEIKE